jgi:hypothetical protein
VWASFLESWLVAMARRMQGQIRLREVPGRSTFLDLARDLFWHGDVHLTMVLEAKDSSVTVLQFAADANSMVRVGRPTLSIFRIETRRAQKEETGWL